MLRAHVYAARAVAERVIAAIDAARHPDGTEEVTVPDGARERRTPKTWAVPIEIEDGRFAVPYEARRLGPLADREVTVGAQRVRVPREDEAVDLEAEEHSDGRVVVREKRAGGGGGGAIRGR